MSDITFQSFVTDHTLKMTDFLEYPSMTCELRGAMSPGQLKLTDEKVLFNHSKSGRKDEVKVGEPNLRGIYFPIIIPKW